MEVLPKRIAKIYSFISWQESKHTFVYNVITLQSKRNSVSTDCKLDINIAKCSAIAKCSFGLSVQYFQLFNILFLMSQ